MNGLPQKQSAVWAERGLLLAVLLFSVILPRLILLGGLPSTDEGYYAYQAQLIHHSFATGQGLPDVGTLALYPMLLAWIFELGPNPTILLRFADLCVATVMALLFYQVLVRESASKVGAALITAIFVFTLNQSLFIQYGFKNSITAAFVPLLLAIRIGQHARSDATRTWFWCGSLLALAVLLRETFVPFALVGLVAIYFAKGRGAALNFAIGGVVTGVLIVGLMLVSRGGITETIQSYRDAGIVYASIQDQRLTLFMSNGWASVQESTVALLCSGLAMLVLLGTSLKRHHQPTALRFVFWLLVATVPLIEPISKIGFPYHFAVSLVGLAGLCACAWREASRFNPIANWAATGVGVVAVAFLVGKYSTLLPQWPTTREAIAAARTGSWPSDAVQRSNYLLAADAIRKVTPPGGTVSVSGFMFALYPLTGHLPPSPELANLSAAIIKMDLSASRLQAALHKCSPDVIMTTTRTDWPGATEISSAIAATGLYEKVAEIPPSPHVSYGHFGGSVFRKLEKSPCAG